MPQVTAVQSALSRVKTITQVLTYASAAEQPKSDPLRDALIAIKSARDAVTADVTGLPCSGGSQHLPVPGLG